jgi:hypothetical protein
MMVTKQILFAAGIPSWDIAKFNARWPDGCEVTVENLLEAQRIGLSPSALFHATATPELIRAYDQACSAERARHWDKIDASKASLKDTESEHKHRVAQLEVDAIIAALEGRTTL